MKERTIATYTTDKFRLQLVHIIKEDIGTDGWPTDLTLNKYEVRLNRKILKRSISEYEMRKLFAMYVQNQVLQLKIY